MIFTIILTIVGLCVFEIVSSIDNAIVNAEVLSTMGKKARRWFLLWGLLFAVFFIRGVLPWLIVWIASPGLGPIEALTAAFSGDPKVIQAIESSAPPLMMAGGVFLTFLFFHWLFIEPKNFGFPFEKFFLRNSPWFYAVVSVLLLVIVYLAIDKSKILAFATVIGSTAFFITHGFKQNAEQKEAELQSGKISDISKILYLEMIDLCFSVDGVLGAFAFTMSVVLILIGNGIGAFVVRELTIGNIERVKKYRYLKNGAMYSILGLGTIMILEGFGAHLPIWISPVLTLGTVAWFFHKSYKELQLIKK
jgi:uncharacterized protein